jgi:hypothetical protein
VRSSPGSCGAAAAAAAALLLLPADASAAAVNLAVATQYVCSWLLLQLEQQQPWHLHLLKAASYCCCCLADCRLGETLLHLLLCELPASPQHCHSSNHHQCLPYHPQKPQLLQQRLMHQLLLPAGCCSFGYG